MTDDEQLSRAEQRDADTIFGTLARYIDRNVEAVAGPEDPAAAAAVRHQLLDLIDLDPADVLGPAASAEDLALAATLTTMLGDVAGHLEHIDLATITKQIPVIEDQARQMGRTTPQLLSQLDLLEYLIERAERTGSRRAAFAAARRYRMLLELLWAIDLELAVALEALRAMAVAVGPAEDERQTLDLRSHSPPPLRITTQPHQSNAPPPRSCRGLGRSRTRIGRAAAPT